MGGFSTVVGGGGGITKLSELTIDVDKDWLGHVIKNLGAPVNAGDAVRLPVLRANMEYPTVDVSFAYLAAIDALTFIGPGAMYGSVVVNADFADRAVEAVMGGYDVIPAVARFVDENNSYYIAHYISWAASDHRVQKVVAGTFTDLGVEAVDLSSSYPHRYKLSCLATSVKSFRNDMATPKISVTDTSFSSGKYGYGQWAQSPLHFSHIITYLRQAASPSPKPLAYFEAPVVGSGTREDPFRVQMPEETAWEWSLNPALKKKYDLLIAKGFTDEEIATLFPEVLSCTTNRLALTHSSLIKTDKATGKPAAYTAIVRVFDQPDRQAHLRPILNGLTALRGMVGVRELTRDEAIKRAKQIDPDLTDVDLTRVPPTDVNFKTILSDYIRHREAVGVKRELIDEKLMERYLSEEKGW